MSHRWFFRAYALPKSRKTFGIRSFFYEKWLLPHVLAGQMSNSQENDKEKVTVQILTKLYHEKTPICFAAK